MITQTEYVPGLPSTGGYVYENGLPVDYLCTWYECRNGCARPDEHGPGRQYMMNWIRSMPGQARVRIGKIGIIQGQEVNLKRLDNE